MFKARGSKPERTPRKGGDSPLEELRECVARMNSIIQASWCGNLNGGLDNSPLKQASSLLKQSNDASKSNWGPMIHKDFDSQGLIDAQFVQLQSTQEQEMIELLRRIAEIVVQGEQRAAADENSSSSDYLEQLDQTNTNNSIFEFFCETNVLGIIINIVTGVAFFDDDKQAPSNGLKHLSIDNADDNADDNSNDDNSDEKQTSEPDEKKENTNILRYLPPIAVATQAIQSISILMQNVAKVTSLYFILSNNRVNDLINLPLEYYSAAEQNRNQVQNGNSNGSGRKKSESAEMSELTTHFVSFLKSLAMRMNPETLQFYLTYPVQSKTSVDFSAIQFPLYKRALEFCNPDEDTFVRVTGE